MTCDLCRQDLTITVEWTLSSLAPFMVRGRSTLASRTSRLCLRCGGAEEPETKEQPHPKRGKR